MVRIAPVNLPYNPKTLWFDAGELELHAGCDVVVQTARGTEFGHMGEPAFEATPDTLVERRRRGLRAGCDSAAFCSARSPLPRPRLLERPGLASPAPSAFLPPGT